MSKKQSAAGSNNAESNNGTRRLATIPAEISMVEDPLAEFFRANWKKILVIVLAVMAALYIKQSFDDTYAARMSEAAELLRSIQKEYETFEGILIKQKSPGTKKEELDKLEADLAAVKKRLSDSLTVLSDARSPYREISGIYRLMVNADQGQLAAALQTLDQKTAPGIEALSHEMMTWYAARKLLDSPEYEKKAIEVFKSIATNGSYFRSPAAITLANIANSPEEKSEARSLIEKILSEEPEQSATFEALLKRLGN